MSDDHAWLKIWITNTRGNQGNNVIATVALEELLNAEGKESNQMSELSAKSLDYLQPRRLGLN